MKTFLLSCLLVLSAACTTTDGALPPGALPPGATPSLTQQALTATTVSYQALDVAIVTADDAVKSGLLKGNDARNTLKALTDAKMALDVARVALRAANEAAAAAPAASAPVGAKP